MGLLKHAVLPFNALVMGAFAYKLLIAEDYADMMADWGNNGDSPMTPMEHHLFHVVGGTALVTFINCIAAIFVENSHYRMMVCALQLLFFSVDGWSYLKLGVPVSMPVYLVVGANVVGLVVHSQEPGLFTKDKSEAGKKKK
ncbi:hypothetical protein ACHAXM_006657 [Skeletonema potamos]|jgi:hypothetical protein